MKKVPGTCTQASFDLFKIFTSLQEYSTQWFYNRLKDLPKFENTFTVQDVPETTSIIQTLLVSPRGNAETIEMFIDIFGSEVIELAFELMRNKDAVMKAINEIKPSSKYT